MSKEKKNASAINSAGKSNSPGSGVSGGPGGNNGSPSVWNGINNYPKNVLMKGLGRYAGPADKK